MRRVMTLLPSMSAIFVGAASFAVSYNTLRLEAVSLDAVADGWPSYLIPLMLDGAVLSGSAVLWKASLDGGRRPVFPYLFVASLVALSVVVNVAHSGPALLAQVIAALPPLVLLGCLELVVISHRASRQELGERTAPAHAAPASSPRPALAPARAASVAPQSSPAGPATGAAPVSAVPPAHQPATAPAALRPQDATRTPGLTLASPAGPRTSQPAAAGDRPVFGPAPQPVPARPVAVPALSVPDAAPGQALQGRPAAAATPGSDHGQSLSAVRPLRVAAAVPEDPARPSLPRATRAAGDPVSAAGVADSPVRAADLVVRLFQEHVRAGGDPADPQLTGSLAAQAKVSAAYVRKVIKPLRDQLLTV